MDFAPLAALRESQKVQTNCFYTPRGYIFPINSFVFNKSTSKPSTNFVDFMHQTAPFEPPDGPFEVLFGTGFSARGERRVRALAEGYGL
jgi:hypothetical protein